MAVTYLKVKIIRSRWARFCLHFEWAALPIGVGFAAISPMNIYNAMQHPNYWFLFMSSVILSLIFLSIGIYRPMHRRYGMRRRNALWLAPDK